jgi:hypothetical protein
MALICGIGDFPLPLRRQPKGNRQAFGSRAGSKSRVQCRRGISLESVDWLNLVVI